MSKQPKPSRKTSSPAGKTRTVKRVLADGSEREYTYAVRTRAKEPTRYKPDSIASLLLAYEQSPEWRALAEQTRRTYKVYLRDLHRLKDYQAKAVTRRAILTIRDGVAHSRGNGAGAGFMNSVGAIFAWAVDRDWIEVNPALGAKPLPKGTLPAWTEAEARLAMRDLSEPLRRAVVLAYHTGQRRGDLVRLPWSAYDGSTIKLRQQKTGVALTLPVHPLLRAELEAWKQDRNTTTILAAPRGASWTGQNISYALPPALVEIGITRRLTIHGLRKLAATRLAEAGCSAHEIAAITGHKSLAMVAHYTTSADQERLASAAIIRLQQSGNAKQRRKDR